jgi:hypothetical protein
MTATSEVFKALPEVFETALVLTGSTEAEEAVVSDGIGSIEFGNIVREDCVLRNVRASLRNSTTRCSRDVLPYHCNYTPP